MEDGGHIATCLAFGGGEGGEVVSSGDEFSFEKPVFHDCQSMWVLWR